MHNFRDENQPYSLRIGLWQNLTQCLQRSRMRVPDSDGITLFARIAQSKLQLPADRAQLRNII
jgi:hypothetical protein